MMAVSPEKMAELDSDESSQADKLEVMIDEELRRCYGLEDIPIQCGSETVMSSLRVKEELIRRYREAGWAITVVEKNDGSVAEFKFFYREKKATFSF